MCGAEKQMAISNSITFKILGWQGLYVRRCLAFCTCPNEVLLMRAQLFDMEALFHMCTCSACPSHSDDMLHVIDAANVAWCMPRGTRNSASL